MSGTLNCLLAFGSGASVPPGTATFDPANKSSNITLSGGNLVATSGAGAGNGTNVRSTNSYSTGKKKAEFTLSGNASGAGIGIAKSTFNVGNSGEWLGSNTNGFALFTDGHVYFNGADADTGLGTFSVGDTITMEIDFDAQTVRFAKGTGALTAPYDVSFLSAGARFFIVEGETPGVVWAVNCGTSTYVRAATPGYENW